MPGKDSKDYRSRAEEIKRIRHEHVKRLSGVTDLERQQLIEELRVHQIELELQAEDLKSARAQAEEARDHFFQLFDLAPVAYLVVDASGRIFQANRRAQSLYDASGTALSRRSLTNGFVEEDAAILPDAIKEVSEGASSDMPRLRFRGIAPWKTS